MIISPVGAAGTLTKAKVKKIAKKQATIVVDEVSNAYELRRSGAFEPNTTVGSNLDDPASLVASLPLDPGSYVASSTFTVTHFGANTVSCALRAGQDSDDGSAYASDTGQKLQAVAMTVAHTFTGPGAVELRCDDLTPADDTDIFSVEITAIEAAGLTQIAA